MAQKFVSSIRARFAAPELGTSMSMESPAAAAASAASALDARDYDPSGVDSA